MIKLESAHIEEVRGIRKLDIDWPKSTCATRSERLWRVASSTDQIALTGDQTPNGSWH